MLSNRSVQEDKNSLDDILKLTKVSPGFGLKLQKPSNILSRSEANVETVMQQFPLVFPVKSRSGRLFSAAGVCPGPEPCGEPVTAAVSLGEFNSGRVCGAFADT